MQRVTSLDADKQQAARSPNSALALSEDRKPCFASEYSDPNNSVHKGLLVTLLTVGKVLLGQGKAERRGLRREARAERKSERRAYAVEHKSGASSSYQAQIPALRRHRDKKGRRMMKGVSYAVPWAVCGASCALTSGMKGVLYLMIVNMSTTEELSKVRETMEVQRSHSGS